MSGETVRARVSISEGLLEFEGSESFVSEQLSKFADVITAGIALVKSPPIEKKLARDKTNGIAGKPGDIDVFANVFAVADGKVQILKTLPGKSKGSKTINAALLLAFANDLLGQSSTSYDSIRNLCSAHACLDGSNFSKTIKNAKEYLMVTGAGAAQAVTLTVPGKRKAEELANSLNS